MRSAATSSGSIPAGALARPNVYGVPLGGGGSDAPDTIIDSNIISGNTAFGITTSRAAGTVISNNRIGTDITGTFAIGNTGKGIASQSAGCVVGIRIGGPGAGNVISGNGGGGVNISVSDHSVVQRNYIGTDATGLLPVPNSDQGLVMSSADDSLIDGNVISGNGNNISPNLNHGIHLSSSDNNLFQNNLVGVGSDGVTVLPNAQAGMVLGSFSDGNTVVGNTIANNADDGIQLTTNVALGNLFSRNSIYANDGLGRRVEH